MARALSGAKNYTSVSELEVVRNGDLLKDGSKSCIAQIGYLGPPAEIW